MINTNMCTKEGLQKNKIDEAENHLHKYLIFLFVSKLL